MQKSENGRKFSAFVFLNDDKKRVHSCAENPDGFVKYGKYEMRLRDKILVEKGHLTRAKVKWYGGGLAHPYLWKDNPSDPDYHESWHDPRLPKEVIEKKQQELEDRFRRKIPPKRTVPSSNSSKKGPKMSK